MREPFSQYGIKIPAGTAGGNVKALCPRCSHQRKKQNDPCLSVNVEEGVWKCHNCGWAGGLKRHQEKEWRPVVEKTKPQTPADEMYRWFENRGIPREFVDRVKIFQERRFVAAVSSERNCIGFPYYVGETLVNVKYRDGGKNFSQIPNADKILFKVNDLVGQTQCVVCEGEMDALSFDVVGFTAAVSVPDGAINPNDASADGKLKCLDNCWEYFEPMEEIFIATDNDPPGLRLREELARRFGRQRCFIVRYPDGCKDANEVLMRYGAPELSRCIHGAEPYPIEGTYPVNNFRNDMLAVYDAGYPTAAKTGISTIDNLIEWAQGEFTVWSGIPSHFKSSICDQIHIRLCEQAGWRVAVFSPEHYPPITHIHRLAEQRVGKVLLPPKHSSEERMTREELSDALDWLNQRFFYIQPEGDSFPLDEILSRAEYLVRRFGVNALIIDPWNHIENQTNRNAKETDAIGGTLRKIRGKARELGIHLSLIAHTTKIGKKVDGTWPVPTPYDISGSANFYNVPDNIVITHKVIDIDGNLESVDFHVAKIKYQWRGKLGKASLRPGVAHRFEPITSATLSSPLTSPIVPHFQDTEREDVF